MMVYTHGQTGNLYTFVSIVFVQVLLLCVLYRICFWVFKKQKFLYIFTYYSSGSDHKSQDVLPGKKLKLDNDDFIPGNVCTISSDINFISTSAHNLYIYILG